MLWRKHQTAHMAKADWGKKKHADLYFQVESDIPEQGTLWVHQMKFNEVIQELFAMASFFPIPFFERENCAIGRLSLQGQNRKFFLTHVWMVQLRSLDIAQFFLQLKLFPFSNNFFSSKVSLV